MSRELRASLYGVLALAAFCLVMAAGLLAAGQLTTEPAPTEVPLCGGGGMPNAVLVR